MNRATRWVFAAAFLAPGLIGISSSHPQERAVVVPPPGTALSELISGYYFRLKETQTLQDDESANPGSLWTEYGAELWSTAEGAADKACASCHRDAQDTMTRVGASYPKFYMPLGKPINVEQRINLCRTENMQAPAWGWESDELLAMTTFVKRQSRGLPVSLRIDGPAKPFFEKGKAFFYRRFGQIDMACNQCHEKYYGKHLRADWLSQGHTNGYPAYNLGYQRLISLQEMFRHCNERVRATPYDFGADEYVNLELYMAWRGSGLPVETPAVR